MKPIFPGIFKKGKQLFTKSLIKDDSTYARSIVWKNDLEFREWDPQRSKAAAAIMKGIKVFPIKSNSKILYLGIASGGTASFFSDIIGNEGAIYGIEISERSIRDLNMVAEKRGNIIPILSDARKPEEYEWVEPVDIVYEDVASDDQTPILIRNAKKFLKPDGYALYAIKSRSIDVTKNPKIIYKEEIEKLSKHFKVVDKVELDPFEKDHMFVVMKQKK